jgi:hypothetical protein
VGLTSLRLPPTFLTERASMKIDDGSKRSRRNALWAVCGGVAAAFVGARTAYAFGDDPVFALIAAQKAAWRAREEMEEALDAIAEQNEKVAELFRHRRSERWPETREAILADYEDSGGEQDSGCQKALAKFEARQADLAEAVDWAQRSGYEIMLDRSYVVWAIHEKAMTEVLRARPSTVKGLLAQLEWVDAYQTENANSDDEDELVVAEAKFVGNARQSIIDIFKV